MNEKILLGHGSGGKLTHNLINDLFIKYFKNSILDEQTDSAICDIPSDKIAFTTDSYVINPIFFPGGNIGKLAVCGTINDLAVSGAEPKYLSVSFIIEEGFSYKELEIIVRSIADETKKNGIKIVTGDTKVVNKGECDKIFINTTGIGIIEDKDERMSYGRNIEEGDKILINGFIGDHGMAILSARESSKIFSDIKTDCASLSKLIKRAKGISKNIKFARDVTRGGLATVLSELTDKINRGIEIYEDKIPVRENVAGICEMLGFDPLYVANEGKVILVVGKNDADIIIKEWKKDKLGKNSAIIGEVVKSNNNKVILNTAIGGKRIVEMLSGHQLPRIC